MKSLALTSLLSGLILTIPVEISYAENSPIPNAPLSPEVRAIQNINFDKIDFTNNTFGEIIIKLNSMIHKVTKEKDIPVVLLNLKGMSEKEIALTLERKVLRMEPIHDVPLAETVVYLCQFMNCRYDRKGLALIVTPIPPYKDRTFDVQTMLDSMRAKKLHEK